MSQSVLSQLIVHNFPQTGVALNFGYGSKVIKQNSQLNESDLVDIIFVVDDPIQWHRENYDRNSQHYSFLKYFPNRVELTTQIQENYGAKIYFNPYVRLGTISIKYGVIKTAHLLEDLLHWTKLYVAGRLHKPVDFIINTCDKNDNLKNAIKFNKESAIRAALLKLPETFNPYLLYKTIVGLSYHGDVRMLFGEDKNKIENIVSSQTGTFDQLYMPIIKHSSLFKDSVLWNESKNTFTQDLSPKITLKNLKLLPKTVRQTICQMHSSQVRCIESDIVLASAARSINSDKIVHQALECIVRRSSFGQSFKGLLTAGIVKSLKYSQRKLMKSMTSRLNRS